MPPLKLLFVCSRNQWRSPTAEALFHGSTRHQARSAGTEAGARRRVTPGLLGWADIIFAMEKKHLRRLQEKFSAELTGKRLICLNIPDDYTFMDDALVALLQSAISAHLPLPD